MTLTVKDRNRLKLAASHLICEAESYSVDGMIGQRRTGLKLYEAVALLHKILEAEVR